MVIYINQEIFIFEVKTYLKTFYPNEELLFTTEPITPADYSFLINDDELVVIYYQEGQKLFESSYNQEQIKEMGLSQDSIEKRKAFKKLIKHLIYSIELNKNTSTKQPWGILTGIRPTKVVFNLREKLGMDTEKIKEILKKDYKISEEKILLMLEIEQKENAILRRNEKEDVSVYLGIPFCPTKCLYCSFTSFSIEKWQHRVGNYLEALKKELFFVQTEMIKGRRLRSIYIGGGTPTSINSSQLEQLMKEITATCNLDSILEWTVEAGRPDTITREKLEILKAYGVDRISINPQTMHQKTLNLIGRNHTVEDIYRSFEDARRAGFRTINMDIIVGLPGETVDDVNETMKQIQKISPENLTVHTMAIKKGSELIGNASKYTLEKAESIEEMIRITSEGARLIGLEPYYLYRQKHMVGNFENVGYARPSHECIYNVEIIEEKQTILAVGAGATTKMIKGTKLERIENVKDVSQYISRVDEMIMRKRAFKNFA